MKKAVLLLSAAVISFSAIAQEDKQAQKEGKHERKEMKDHDFKHDDENRRHELLEQLNLSDEQKNKMKDVNESFRGKIQELRKNESMPGEEKKAKT